MDGFESPPSSAGTANGATLATPHSTLDKVDSPAELASIQVKQLWKFRMRFELDDLGKDWWFASTAIPLLAATSGPLANVMSIAALITSWRNNYDPAYPGQDSRSVGFPDPHWCIALNAASLVCGFVGNIFLLFNFTRRIRYIVALPMTIVLWYLATGIVSGFPCQTSHHYLYSISLASPLVVLHIFLLFFGRSETAPISSSCRIS